MSFWIVLGVVALGFLILTIIGFVSIKKDYNSLSDEAKQKIAIYSDKVQSNAKMTSCKHMDSNGILMVLCDDTNSITKRKLYVFKDDKSGKYFYLDSKNGIHHMGIPALSVNKFMDTDYHYNEEQLVFTSATVGGVTTGGFHIEGGDYSKQKYFTGKYVLTCPTFDGTEGIVVDKIYLNSNLLEKAKQSDLKKYIDGTNKLVLKNILSKKTQQALDNAAIISDPTNVKLDGLYAKVSRAAKAEEALTYDECKKIDNWYYVNLG